MMDLIQTILAFLVVLAVLIVVHELGHYWVARWCGVKVLRFSVGMGKVIFSRKVGPDQTEWAISILPLGGYVKMLDAREQDVTGLTPDELKREFTHQSVGRRTAIVAAGPIANFILAILIFSGVYMYGMPEPVPKLGMVPEKTVAYQAGLRGGEVITAINGEPIKVWSELHWKFVKLAVEKQAALLEVQKPSLIAPGTISIETVTIPVDNISTKDLEGDFLRTLGLGMPRPFQLGKIGANSPAMKAGLKEGDRIIEMNGIPVRDIAKFIELVGASPNLPIKIRGVRNQQEFNLEVTPESKSIDCKLIGRINVELVPDAPELITISHNPISAVGMAVEKTWDSSILTLKLLRKIIIGEVSWKNISGPITIADYAGKTAKIGLISYISFIAVISLSLGIMNLLPIPVLDGGHLMYYSLEFLTGKPLSKKVEEIAQKVGLGLLMALMLVAFYNDIMRQLPKNTTQTQCAGLTKN
jgi:regulator of sigma E protease